MELIRFRSSQPTHPSQIRVWVHVCKQRPQCRQHRQSQKIGPLRRTPNLRKGTAKLPRSKLLNRPAADPAAAAPPTDPHQGDRNPTSDRSASPPRFPGFRREAACRPEARLLQEAVSLPRPNGRAETDGFSGATPRVVFGRAARRRPSATTRRRSRRPRPLPFPRARPPAPAGRRDAAARSELGARAATASRWAQYANGMGCGSTRRRHRQRPAAGPRSQGWQGRGAPKIATPAGSRIAAKGPGRWPGARTRPNTTQDPSPGHLGSSKAYLPLPSRAGRPGRAGRD